MKIYLPTINLSNIHINKINNYLHNCYQKVYVLSQSGLYEITEKSTLRLEIIDGQIVHYKIGDIPLIMDKSIIKIDEEYFQIPIDHISDKVLSKEFLLRKGGMVSLVIDLDANDNNMVRNFYFNANDNIDKNILDNDISSFLKELNLY